MTRDELIKAARNAGIVIDIHDIDVISEIDLKTLWHFAEIIVQEEREACAVLCETECAQNDGITCAEAIRERS
jgi:hypothetical protein